MKIIFLLFGLIICVALSGGCGDSKQRAEERTRIQSFTNNLEKADVQYAVSIVATTLIIQQAVQAAELPAVQTRLQYDPSYDAAKDYLQNYAHFDISITNGQAAFDLVRQEESDFEYIYTHEKNLPSDFKDNFHNVQNMLSKNLDFISSLKNGNIDKETVRQWNDSPKSLNDSYHNMLLEIDRLQK